MKLPVDIPTVLTAAIDIERARAVPVSVNILIDESASPEFQVFVRAGFNSETPNSRVFISYFPTQKPDPYIDCDLAIVAAGQSADVGAIAAAFREAGTPAMVVAESGEAVLAAAEASGFPLPEGDVVSLGAGEVFGEDLKGALADKVGAWIVDALPEEKRLAFSVAYPFVRRPLAYAAIRATSWQNAGVGVVVFVPGADMPIMTANQIKMLLQIAAAYGQPLSADRIKELVAVLLNGFFFRSISRQLAGLVPALGWAVKGSMGFIGTQAIGHAAIEYFEAGGDVAGLASLVNKTVTTVLETTEDVRSQPTYQAVAAKVGPVARKAAVTVLDAAAPVAKSAAKTAFNAARPGSKARKNAKAARKAAASA